MLSQKKIVERPKCKFKANVYFYMQMPRKFFENEHNAIRVAYRNNYVF